MIDAITMELCKDELEKQLNRSRILLANSITYIVCEMQECSTNEEIYNIMITELGMSIEEVFDILDETGFKNIK